jgi:manganese-dependent inorganic pyrophosphatase
MGITLIFGHKNPDTDSICSALVYADLKTKRGERVEAVRLGNINGETQFVLNHFHMQPPRLVNQVSNETSKVILVDHNERQQSAIDIEQVQVMEVIDHHRIANFETSGPLYYRAEPVGCTATILNKMYREHGISVEPSIAGLMLSAIISDTLLFKSPTCTQEDIVAAKELASLAGVNAESYGLQMLKAGADVSGKTAEQLVSLDSKEFSMGNAKLEIAQVNVVDPTDVLTRQAEIETTLMKLIEKKQLDVFMFIITDILHNDSIAIVLGRGAKVVERAYSVTLIDNRAVLKGVVSRKAQVIPVLTEAFQKA